MAVRFQLRRDTAANWASANPTLALGEPGVETDTLKIKIGDGVTAWNSLDYSISNDYGDLLNTPTTLSGYGITDAVANSSISTFGASLVDDADASTARTTLGLGTAATTASTDYATSAQGGLADSAVQPGDNIETSLIDSADSSAITITPDVVMSAGLTVGNHIIPSSNENIDLGSATNRFRELFLSGNTISLDSIQLSSTGTALRVHDGNNTRRNIESHNIDANDITANDVTAAGDVDVTGNLTMTGYIAGPATFVIDPAAVGDDTGTLVIAGNLQVDGTTTTINSTTLEVEDKNVVLGPNAANDAANNGAGLTVTQPDTSDASLIYNTTDTQWELNKDLDVTGAVTATEINLDATGDIHSTVDTGYVGIAGGTNSNVGANALFYGGTHATLAGVTKFRSGSTGTVTILANGNVGIGYDSPSDNIHILGSNASPNVGITLQSDDTANATAAISLFARDASNVNKVSEIKNVAGQLFIERSDAGTDVLALKSTAAGVGGPQLDFYHHSATPANNDVIGTINFNGWDSGSNPTTYARMSGIASDVTNGSEKGDLILSTRTDASTFSEKVRIKNNGDTGVGTDNPGTKLHVQSGTSNQLLTVESTSSSAARIIFQNTGNSFSDVNIWAQNQDFVINTGTNDEAVRVKDTGRVGIGTAGGTVDHLLHVKSDTGATPLVHFDNTGGQATHGPALKVSASGRGVGVKDASVFAVHNLAEEIFSVRNDGHAFAYDYILKAIDTDISDTAVDVFVYDTTKDSDGGAWRKRTQHTSWYNETLNTATRGARKEFPAVAVIVAESTQVTIYDGDDPDLPMWMVFNHDGYGNMLGENSNSSVAMLNARIVLGCNPHDLYVVDFLKDGGWSHSDNVVISGTYFGNISERNIGNGRPDADSWIFGTVPNIINRTVNDVAMTVLLNAPIDSATGLPVPTIAVATAGGVSVIKDDGNVYDIAFNAYGFNTVDFQGDEHILAGTRNLGPDASALYVNVYPIPSADVGATMVDEFIVSRSAGTDNGASANIRVPFGDGANDAISNKGSISFIATNEGLLYYTPSFNDTTASASMGVGITSDYNTGWMNGDIKLATLSDTDATNVTGAELVTNGTFDTDTSGWTASSGTSLSVDTNRLKVTVNTGGDNAGYQVITTVSGYTYTLSATLQKGSTNGNALIRVGTGVSSSAYGSTEQVTSTSATEVSITFTPTGTSTYITAICSNAGNHAFFDNISVRLAEEDRSVNGNGLQVFGTVTKTAVATGADLVAYSGFSGSNYLTQPYNSDLDVGTGDFSIAIWAKADAFDTYNAIFAQWRLNQTDAEQFTLETVGSKLFFYVTDGGSFSFAGGNTTLNTGAWYQFIVTRRSGTITVYINGVAESTTDTYSGDLTSRDDPLVIGGLWSATGPSGGIDAAGAWNGSLALARFSATAPSAEQIKKIYEDERFLFQENAQATLYGTSNAVTALAYDDSTKLLHAGTSDGRSVFNGLHRIDNTTDAVTTAISASNGTVAEE